MLVRQNELLETKYQKDKIMCQIDNKKDIYGP